MKSHELARLIEIAGLDKAAVETVLAESQITSRRSMKRLSEDRAITQPEGLVFTYMAKYNGGAVSVEGNELYDKIADEILPEKMLKYCDEYGDATAGYSQQELKSIVRGIVSKALGHNDFEVVIDKISS
jgi:hypothetical protein